MAQASKVQQCNPGTVFRAHGGLHAELRHQPRAPAVNGHGEWVHARAGSDADDQLHDKPVQAMPDLPPD